jgi:hypothetical protein
MPFAQIWALHNFTKILKYKVCCMHDRTFISMHYVKIDFFYKKRVYLCKDFFFLKN